MNTIERCNAAESGTVQTVSAVSDQISIQAKGRGMAMNEVKSAGKDISVLNKLNDYDDVTEKVICKITALTSLFEFYEYTKGMTDFRIKTIPVFSTSLTIVLTIWRT